MTAPLAPLPDLERSLWCTATRFDATYMDALLHANFAEFGRSGRRYSRQEILDAPRSEIDADLRDLRVAAVGVDAALVTYVSAVRHEALDLANRASLWLWQDQRWQLRFHQGTPCGT